MKKKIIRIKKINYNHKKAQKKIVTKILLIIISS